MSTPESAHYGNGGATAYVANERLAAQDAERRAWLDRACRAPEPRSCRHCERPLAQNNRSGICGSSRCYRATQLAKAGKPAPKVNRPPPRQPRLQWPTLVASLSVRELRRVAQLAVDELAKRSNRG